MQYTRNSGQTNPSTPVKTSPSGGDEPVLVKIAAAETAVLLHVHEFEGSTKLAEIEEEPHNHRFAGVTGPEMDIPGDTHIHLVFTRTDFFDDHYHFIDKPTGLPIPVGNGKHVHFLAETTTEADDHVHEFQFATLIQNPLQPAPVDP